MSITHALRDENFIVFNRGPTSPRTQDRVDVAVRICQIYGALGGSHSLTCLASVWWDGLTFDSRKYPQGVLISETLG